MGDPIRDHYDAFPDPSPTIVPIDPGQLERVEDTLHYAWAWYRHKLAFRKSNGIRILDAGCGTGLTTIGLARLNAGSTVVGVDLSARSLDLARKRAEASLMEGVEFLEHDLKSPIPSGLGMFDFIVACRMLGNSGEDPTAILKNLVASLDPRGLLLATFPSAAGRLPARQLQRGIDALLPPAASAAERAEIGLELLRSLHPDHPIRRFDAFRHGTSLPDATQFVSTYLNDRSTSWTLEDVQAVIRRAGLRCLYVADRGGWHPERIFGPNIPDRLRDRVAALDETSLAVLKDSLDVSLHPDSYLLYCCHEAYEPHTPGWPEESDLAIVDRLIPHATGLAIPLNLNPDPAAARGRVSYIMASGLPFEMNLQSHLALLMVDGAKSIGEIETSSDAQPFEDDGPDARRARWFELSNHGVVLLESPDPRQYVDCVHLGPIKDRLDCACPRRWVRGCEVHDVCTLMTVGADDPKYPVVVDALSRLQKEKAMACDRCPDYSPES